MAAPPLVYSFIGAVFTAILYGVYCLIFGLYWRIQLKRTNKRKGVLLYPLIACFILCTAYFVITIIQTQFQITMSVLNDDSLITAFSWLIIAIDALYTVIDSISQIILLYRCWILWRQPLIMVIPCTLSIAFLATALTTLGFNIKSLAEDLPFNPEWYLSAVTAFFFISLAVNALVTALVVYKIITVYQEVRGLSALGDGQRDLYYPLISILVESGLITFVGQLVQTIMYKSADNAFPLIGGSVVMLYGISTTVVLVRVEMGVSYDHATSRIANSTNSGPPVQLAPFQAASKASKVNQTVSATDSAGSDDERSEGKFVPNGYTGA